MNNDDIAALGLPVCVDETSTELSLDPADWERFRACAHAALDDAIEFVRSARQRPVWQPVPDGVLEALAEPLPRFGQDLNRVYQEFKHSILPYSTGNTHPRVFRVGARHGFGQRHTGRDADRRDGCQLRRPGSWRDLRRACSARLSKELFGFPDSASGLLVSGTSMANLIALAVARNARDAESMRADGVRDYPPRLVAYASSEIHDCVVKAMELPSPFARMPPNRRCHRKIVQPPPARWRVRSPRAQSAISSLVRG